MIINYNNKTRAIKTIKTRMYRYMTLKQFQRDIDRLQEFAQSYNKTYHRSIATKPELVNPYNEREVRVSTFRSREEIPRKQKKSDRTSSKWGDKVRRSVFDREYDDKWSGKMFVVRSRLN